MTITIDIKTVNGLSREEFIARFGDVFERSPWIAERALNQKPFADAVELHKAMAAVVGAASDEDKLRLLRAHPQLAGREAQAGTLTSASSSEQASVGFNDLSKNEIERVARLNNDYQSRFGFPFIIAVRQSSKKDIFREWERRLKNVRSEEMTAGLEQVYIIAQLRLDGLINKSEKGMSEKSTGKLSTHVLDTANGCPAAGVRIDLYQLDDGDYRLIKTVHTNNDGRTDDLLLDGGRVTAGKFQLVFHIGPYFANLGMAPAINAFLDQVPIRFAISDKNANYHVPLVASPWSYSTYRGS